MPYKVISDGYVTVLNSLGELRHPFNEDITGYEHESVLRAPGEVIPDDEVSPVVKQLYEEGDEHTLSILKLVSDKPSKPKPAPKQRAVRQEIRDRTPEQE